MYLEINSLYVLRVNNDRKVIAYCCPTVLVLTFIIPVLWRLQIMKFPTVFTITCRYYLHIYRCVREIFHCTHNERIEGVSWAIFKLDKKWMGLLTAQCGQVTAGKLVRLRTERGSMWAPVSQLLCLFGTNHQQAQHSCSVCHTLQWLCSII